MCAGVEYDVKTRDVSYTVCVPETRTRNVQVVRYERVPEERTQTYTVMVPFTVDKEVQVRVCKMVEKTITERVLVSGGCGNGCGNGCGGGCR